ncbi:MAG TPA: hypothetical protein DCE78_10450 [Bacteroidetes bacterium]|nr:hypothetical protein [Bacteroidota bacterium]
MFPAITDFNPSLEYSNTASRVRYEQDSKAISTHYDEQLVDLSKFIEAGVFTSITSLNLVEKPITSLINLDSFSTLHEDVEDDFSVVSTFHFKKSTTIKVRLVKKDFNPPIFLD